MTCTTRAALLGAVALSTLNAPPALAQGAAELRALRAPVEAMARRIEELEARQAETVAQVEQTCAETVTQGSKPGTFRLPGTNTEIEFGGYIKAGAIYDEDESTGDLFVPESITTSGGDDEERFRLHARQSRLFVRTATPIDWGPLTTLVEGDFFGGAGNEVFSNSTEFRLRHAVAGIGGLTVGQTWSNFMPIESYPTTVDFNGPAGIPFIRRAQIRYTHALMEKLTGWVSLENSEFSGPDATGAAIAESVNLGIRAGVDTAPDVTAALTSREDWGLVKLAGVGRSLGAPGGGDDEFGYGLNLSGNASLWEGGKLLGSFTYGDGVGRYLINGFGQDAFVDATGNLETVEAFGLMAGVNQKVTDTVTVGLVYGRSQFEDSVRASDLDFVQTVHATALWSPIPRLTFGAEVIWGEREDAGGASDDALRLQTSAQVSF